MVWLQLTHDGWAKAEGRAEAEERKAHHKIPDGRRVLKFTLRYIKENHLKNPKSQAHVKEILAAWKEAHPKSGLTREEFMKIAEELKKHGLVLIHE